MENIWQRVGIYGEGLNAYDLDLRGSIALDIIKTHALITAVDDGEDSAGRARVTNMTALDTARRACDLADGLVSEFETRSWIKVYDSAESERLNDDGVIRKAISESKAFDAKYAEKKGK